MTDHDGIEVRIHTLCTRQAREEKILEKARQRHKDGDGSACLYTILFCLINKLPVPPWAFTALARGMYKLDEGKAGGLDEAFGWPFKGQQQEARQREKKFAGPLFLKIRERRRANAKVSMNTLFEEVGKEFCLGPSAARALYYKTKNHWKAQGLNLDETEEALEILEGGWRGD
jgi:hypothetical protein